MDWGFAPGATAWENVMRDMLGRRPNTRVSHLIGNESIMDFFKNLNRSGVQADDLIVASHATDEGVLFIDLDALRSGGPATFEALEAVESSHTIEIPAGVRKSTTRFHVKGCRIGADDCVPYLNKLKAALGNPKQVTAPKFFHGVYKGTYGLFEWMGHNYELVVKDAFKKRADLVAAFQKKKFTRLDGTPVDDADIDKWVPRNVQLAPGAGHAQGADFGASSDRTRDGPLERHRQHRGSMSIGTITFHLCVRRSGIAKGHDRPKESLGGKTSIPVDASLPALSPLPLQDV